MVTVTVQNKGSRTIVIPLSPPAAVGKFTSDTLVSTGKFDGPSSVRYNLEGNTLEPGESKSAPIILNRYVVVDRAGRFAVCYRGRYQYVVNGDWSHETRNLEATFSLRVENGPARPEVISSIVADLESLDVEAARHAFERLLYSSFEGREALLKKYGLDDRFYAFRIEGMNALAEFLPNEECRRIIATMPGQNDQVMLRAARRILAAKGEQFPMEILEEWLKKTSPTTRQAVLDWLEAVDAQQYGQLIARFRSSPDGQTSP